MPTLGPYTLLRRIGAGGMGEVWIARKTTLGGAAKLVAIKTVLPDKAQNPESRRMFLDEARLSMLMSNSNIVQVFDADEAADGTCYMAMEYVEGIDLARLTEQLRTTGELLSHSAIAYIVGEVLKALAYAHELTIDGIRRTIIHRDISPHNVMLSSAGEVKVMDFGIARLSSEETSGTFVKGKLRYMPPEQFEKSGRAPSLDLFAVGAILHELLDGQRFRGNGLDEAQLVGMCVRGVVPELSCAPERVPAAFRVLLDGLLEPVAAKRIQSAREAHRVLSRWPGDRDAKFELEAIVRRFVSGSNASDESAVEAASTVAVDRSASKRTPAPVRVAMLADSGRATSEELTEFVNSDRSETGVGRSESAVAAVAHGLRINWIFVALACVGFAVGAFGIGTVLGWRADDAAIVEAPREELEASPEPDIVEPDPPAPSEAAPEPAPQPKPQPQPAPAPQPKPQPQPEPAPPPQPRAPAEPEPKPKRAARTSVSITAAGVWAQVKIGRKEYTIDRLAGTKQIATKLAPGEYAIAFRDDPKATWLPLGELSVPEDGPIAVDIKAGTFSVRK